MADEFDADAAVKAFMSGGAPNSETALRMSLQDTIGKNPDEAAKWRQTAATIGVPVDTAQALPDWSKNTAALQAIDTSALARMNPVTTAFLSDPQNAAIAHDDTADMGLLETLANSFRRGVPSLQQGVAATGLRATQRMLEQFDAVAAQIDGGAKPTSIRAADDPMGVAFMSPEQRATFRASITTPLAGNISTIASTQKERQAIPQPGVVGQVLDAKTFGAAFTAFMAAPVQFIASIGPESLISSAPGLLAAIPAGLAGGPGAAAAVMGAGSFATDYGSSIVEALGSAGVNVADPDALAVAVQNPALMRQVAAEAMAHASVVGAVDGASGGAASKFLLPAGRMAARPVARELANLAIQTPVQGVMGGVGELGGELAAGQEIQPGNILAEIVGESFSAPAEVASIAGGRVRERFAEGRAAEAAAVRVEEALKLAEASKLRERDPASFRQFIDQIAESGESPSEFFIDPQTMANTLNQSGITMHELEALAPALAEQMRPENFVPGADLRLSTADLLTAPSDISASLIDHLRTSEDAMTRTEAKDYLAAKSETIKQEVEAELGKLDARTQYQAEVDGVRDQFQTQMDAAGKFTPEVNKTYATLLGNFYAAQAQRAGLPVQELMDRYQLQVSGKTASRAQTLEQGVVVQANGAGDFFAASSPVGKVAGRVTAGNLQITHAEIDESARGQGQGVALYRALIDDALAKGLTVTSDSTVEAAAVRVYEALGRRGYAVERLAGGTLEDGAAYGTGAKEPAFRITAGPNIVEQGARANLSFADDITTAPSVIALLEGADFSSFLHEGGHFFLEVQSDLASRIEAKIATGAEVSAGERQIVADMAAVLDYLGIIGSPEVSAMNTWLGMSLEEKRDFHETFARSFEAYAMSGKAPSQALEGVFQRFRAWLVSVYKTLAGLNVKLTGDVRSVFDRMLATDAAIQEAQDARNMGPLFQTPEEAGMTPEQFAEYQGLGQFATARATEEVDARLLKDMKWLSRARDKAIKARQKEAAALRSDIMADVRAEVMGRPVYRAWQFLTGKITPRIEGAPARGGAKTLDPAVDNLFQAIAKLGGLNKTMVEGQWGKQDKLESGVFGAPVLRKEGLAIDAMAERLVEAGYLLPDAQGGTDLAVFEELFNDQARGVDRFSIQHDYTGEAVPQLLQNADALSGRLNTDELKRRYGEAPDAVWRVLSDRRMTNATGLDPDVVAEFYDYSSGDEMVREIAAARPPAEVVAELTDQRMLAEHGDITSKAELDRAADEAVHNELRARVIATELKALERATKVRESTNSVYGAGTVDVMARAALNFATEVIGRVKLKNLRPKQYAAAEARSAKMAQQNLGNTAEAAMHKRNQLVNNYATKLAYDAQAEITAADAFFKKVLKDPIGKVAKSRDAGTVQAARAILAAYGIGSKGEPAQSYLKTLAGDDPGMFSVLRDKIDALTADAKPVAEMTVAEFRALADEIKGLWFQAKRSRQVEVDGKLIDIEEAQNALIEKLGERAIPEARGTRSAVTDAERNLTRLQTIRAALRRVEAWAQARDGSKGIGPFRRFVFQPVKEAADAYRADKAKYIKAYKELLESVNVGKGKIAAPELGYTFGASRGGSGKAEILHAILHTGNGSNKRKMLLGRGWAVENELNRELDTTKWDAFVARMISEKVLTKADFDFAQGVWDLLEGTKALAQKTHRTVFGNYFDEVTADEFSNEFGNYRGGYVPAMMDPEVVSDAATRAIQEDEQQTLAYAFPSTQKGFTKARVEHNKPLLLDLRSLASHIDKVLLFSHMEPAVRDVRKILGSKDVSELMHRVDPTAYDGLLTPWLNRAARQVVETKVPGDNGTLRFFSKLRQRAGLAAMFGNISNTAQQITGFSVALLKVRPRYMGHALVSYLQAPRQTAKTVAEASPYMASRMDNEVQVMTDAINEILLNPSLFEKSQQWVGKHGYFLQAAFDNVMGPIIWTGAYNQALEAGESTDDARRLADSAVRETQGSTLPEDVARAETGHPFVRMFTQFAGYFNMQANLLGTEFVNTYHDLGLRRGAGKGLMMFTLGFLVPAMVAELIALGFKGGPEDDDKDGEIWDDWLMAVGVRAPIKGVFAFVPGLGQTLTAGMNATNDKPYDDRISLSPAVSMLESAVVGNVKTLTQLASGADMDGRRVTRDLATLISLTTGLPATAIARPVGYITGVAQNKIAPTSTADALRGAVTGTPSPESKQ